MKIIQINTVPNGSTGTIMMNIHNTLLRNGHESYVVWGRGRRAESKYEKYLNDKIGVFFHVLYSRITGKVGFASKNSTKKLIKWIDTINPDIIHLHNIHGYYINVELLFNYIKEKNIKVIWTLHDCWSFTGHCSHFDSIGCYKWCDCCNKCPQKDVYPKTIFDNSSKCFNMKKNIFNGVCDLTIVTPSFWLANLVKKSFLCNYNVKVINNGIDTSIFKKIPEIKLEFRSKYNLENKKIILGVAAPFTEKKGFYDFLELSKFIDDDYIIVLVGLKKSQIKKLPSNILGLERTNNVYELVDIYNSSDLFLNLSVEETYGLTCVEAYYCGLKSIVYDATSLSEVSDSIGGIKVNKNISKKDLFSLIKKSIYLKLNNKKNINHMSYNMVNKYIDLY